MDMLRQALLLFDSDDDTDNMYPIKKKHLFICMPRAKMNQLSPTQQVYYNSLLAAINTVIRNNTTPHYITLLHLATDSKTSRERIDGKLLENMLLYAESIQDKKVYKKTIYSQPFFARLLSLVKR